MSEPARLRLFVGIRVPTSELEWLAEQTEGLRRLWPDARWIPLDNQHVTLKFLGPTAADRLEAVGTIVATAARGVSPPTLTLAGLGAFPTRTRARVLWVGLDEQDGVLARLADDLATAFEALGYAAERRPFRAHLTLARFKVPQRVSGYLDDVAVADRPAFEVSDLHLFRSLLHPRGARYEVVASFPLGRGRRTSRETMSR